MEKSSLKIQFGSNGRDLVGFVNTDLPEVDITSPLPWGDGEASLCFSEHCVEHVTHSEALSFLDECYRILRHGGQIRLCIPVLDNVTPAHARDLILNHGHMAAYSKQLVKDFLRTAGFVDVRETPRKDIDSHHLEIGVFKDDSETARIEATKP